MYHSITIIGNLGKDPEMRFTPNGQAVCSFSVATTRTYKKNDENVKETVWFRVTTWGKQAEVCNTYLSKGSKVLVVGRLTPDLTTGGPKIFQKGNGESGSSFEVNASEIKFLSPKSESAAHQEPVEEEIPF